MERDAREVSLAVFVVVVAAAVVVVAPTATGEPAVQAQGFSGESADAIVDGEVSHFVVAIGGAVRWSDLPADAEWVEVVVTLKNPTTGSEHVKVWETSSVDGTEGEQRFGFNVDPLSNGNWDGSDLTPERGESKTYTVPVTIEATVYWGSDGAKTVTESTTMSVGVTNDVQNPTDTDTETATATPDPSVSVGGVASPSVG